MPGEMTVRVVDRSQWGRGPYPDVRVVTIPRECPVCAGPRGEPYPFRFHEDGDWFDCDRWENPCGHIDTYEAVLAEARARGEAP